MLIICEQESLGFVAVILGEEGRVYHLVTRGASPRLRLGMLVDTVSVKTPTACLWLVEGNSQRMV